MDPFALYYPYIHVRDDTWLKYAALYWPKMARLFPADYRSTESRDSQVARVLREAKWLIDLPPQQRATDRVGQPFVELISTHSQALRDRFGLNRIDRWSTPLVANDMRSWSQAEAEHAALPEQADQRLAYVHLGKVNPRMLETAIDAGLAVQDRGETWVGMHPELVSAYTCALIERIATENRLHPTTDQVLPHSALSGWTVDRLVRVLLDEPLTGIEDSRSHDDVLDAFVFMAFETVIPAHLDTVPIEKIIEVRSKFGTELDTFRTYVTEQAHRLAELQDVRDLTVYQEYLRTEVEHSVKTQLAQLQERLRSVGLESVRGLANIKSMALPPLAGIAADAVGLPPTVTTPAVLAACVMSAPAKWRRHRQAAIRESPVGYLFRIEQALNPATLIDRLRRRWPTR